MTQNHDWQASMFGHHYYQDDSIEAAIIVREGNTEASVTIRPRKRFTPDHEHLFYGRDWEEGYRTDAGITFGCGDDHARMAKDWCLLFSRDTTKKGTR